MKNIKCRAKRENKSGILLLVTETTKRRVRYKGEGIEAERIVQLGTILTVNTRSSGEMEVSKCFDEVSTCVIYCTRHPDYKVIVRSLECPMILALKGT